MAIWHTARVYLVNGYEHEEDGKLSRDRHGQLIPILIPTEYCGHGESENDAVADIEFHSPEGHIMRTIDLVELAQKRNHIYIELKTINSRWFGS